jgi:hypothetical protein
VHACLLSVGLSIVLNFLPLVTENVIGWQTYLSVSLETACISRSLSRRILADGRSWMADGVTPYPVMCYIACTDHYLRALAMTAARYDFNARNN